MLVEDISEIFGLKMVIPHSESKVYIDLSSVSNSPAVGCRQARHTALGMIG